MVLNHVKWIIFTATETAFYQQKELHLPKTSCLTSAILYLKISLRTVRYTHDYYAPPPYGGGIMH